MHSIAARLLVLLTLLQSGVAASAHVHALPAGCGTTPHIHADDWLAVIQEGMPEEEHDADHDADVLAVLGLDASVTPGVAVADPSESQWATTALTHPADHDLRFAIDRPRSTAGPPDSYRLMLCRLQI